MPTDSTPFYTRGVPILSAFTGMHDEYHTPRDKPRTVNPDGVAEIARLVARLAMGLVPTVDLSCWSRERDAVRI